MKSGFKDPAAIKNQRPKDKPVEGKNSPWDYRSPQYDERDSCFVNAGTHYGVGHAQPVGSMNHQGQTLTPNSCIPFGKVNTMELYGEKE